MRRIQEDVSGDRQAGNQKFFGQDRDRVSAGNASEREPVLGLVDREMTSVT